VGQDAESAAGGLRIVTLPLAGLDETAVAPLLPVLDEEEQRRAARFVFPRHRVEYVAAHALTRAALAAAVPGTAPEAFAFRPGPHGKPEALLGGETAPLSFNLSHTEGMVGLAVAATPGLRLGFDLEALARRVTPGVERTVYRPEELAWLAAQPSGEAWQMAFLRLWTLKESFIKGTGRGIGQGLSTFWFELAAELSVPPRLRVQEGVAERPEEWVFAQRMLPGGFLGALGLHAPGGSQGPIAWEAWDLAALQGALRGDG
jgi:4'-phosphopantetheinyl transferase